MSRLRAEQAGLIPLPFLLFTRATVVASGDEPVMRNTPVLMAVIWKTARAAVARCAFSPLASDTATGWSGCCRHNRRATP